MALSVSPTFDETLSRPPFATRAVLIIAAAKLAGHVLTNVVSPYGIQRDAFLYFAMGHHLRLFRMDFPPAIAILANVERLFGTSLVAVRAVPALAGTATLILAAMVARELGGDRKAQWLAALTMLTSPIFMRPSNLFQPVVLDQLWWTLGLYALVRLGRDNVPRWWVLLGLAGGLGLLTKFSILFFGLAVLLALAASPLRRALASPWPWVALAIALVLGSPSVTGQIALGFPVVAQMAQLRHGQLDLVTPLDFLGTQLLYGPVTLIAIGGVAYLLVARSMRPYRQVAWTGVFAMLILLALHGKAYYLGPVYPALCAAGWVAIRGMPASRARATATWGTLTAATAWGLIMIPIGLPLLPPPQMALYARRLGIGAVTQTNRGQTLQLPQDYADMLGWEAQVQAVAKVFHALTPKEQRTAAVYGNNYGEAGALDFYRHRYDLPPAVSDAGSFWFFGPGDRPGDPLVTIGVDSMDLGRYYDTLIVAAHVTNRWTVPEEQDLTVYVARGARHGTLQDIWPSLAGQN